MAKPKQTFTTADDPAPQMEAPFTAAPEAGPPIEQPGKNGPVDPMPKGFESMDTAPQTGVTLKLWFGETQGLEDFVLARWRKTMRIVRHRWEKTGMWVHPGSNLPIPFEFKAWQATSQVTQQDIDASNFAVNQETERRAKREALRHPDKVSA